LDGVSFITSKSEVTIFFSKYTSFISLSCQERGKRTKKKGERREEKIKRKGYSKKRYIS
jgi:hypothetical protein